MLDSAVSLMPPLMLLCWLSWSYYADAAAACYVYFFFAAEPRRHALFHRYRTTCCFFRCLQFAAGATACRHERLMHAIRRSHHDTAHLRHSAMMPFITFDADYVYDAFAAAAALFVGVYASCSYVLLPCAADAPFVAALDFSIFAPLPLTLMLMLSFHAAQRHTPVYVTAMASYATPSP